MKLQVRWTDNAYAIYDVDVEDPGSRLIYRDNMWEHGWTRVRQEFGGDADAYVLARHEEAIQEYLRTGLTLSDWDILYSQRTLTVPSRTISPQDVDRYHTISVHLGKGIEGARRLHALRLLAAEAGHYWNDEPSIGRWLSAVADERLTPDWKPKPGPHASLKDKVRTLAQQQLQMWQALIEELD